MAWLIATIVLMVIAAWVGFRYGIDYADNRALRLWLGGARDGRS